MSPQHYFVIRGKKISSQRDLYSRVGGLLRFIAWKAILNADWPRQRAFFINFGNCSDLSTTTEVVGKCLLPQPVSI